MDPTGEQQPKTTEEVFAQEALKGLDQAAEELSQRAEGRERTAAEKETGKIEIDEQAKRDTAEFLGEAVGGEKRKGQAMIAGIAEIGDSDENTVFDDEQVHKITEPWIREGITKFEAGKILSGTKLKKEEKEKLIAKLPGKSEEEMSEEEMSEAEAKDKMSEGEAAIKGRIADTIRERAKAIDKETNATIDPELGELEQIPEGERTEAQAEEIKQLNARKARSNDLIGRFTHLFKDGEPGNVFAKRAGKTLYYALLAMFLLIILEMHGINKLSKKK